MCYSARRFIKILVALFFIACDGMAQDASKNTNPAPSAPGTQPAKLSATVFAANGTEIQLTLTGELVPNAGDKVDFFFKVPGLGDEVSVGSGVIQSADGKTAIAKFETGTGKPQAGYLARIHSEAPRKAALPPPSTPDTAAPDPAKPPTLSQQLIGSWRGGRHLTEFRPDGTFVLDEDIVPEPAHGRWTLDGKRLTQTYGNGNQIVVNIDSITQQKMETSDPATGAKFPLVREIRMRIILDGVGEGNVAGDEFLKAGMRLRAVKGKLVARTADKSMVMPAGSRTLLMMEGGQVTELAFEFDPPVKLFAITLPGLKARSSLPTYTLTAYNREGRPFDIAGQERHAPKQALPASIVMNTGEMSRVVLAVDNRAGEKARATFSCLPFFLVELAR